MKINIKHYGINIDLRKEFNTVLQAYGYHVLLLRKGSINCVCGNEVGQAYSLLCPQCLGIGNVIQAEKIKVIGRPGAQYIDTPSSDQLTPAGDIYSPARIFYMTYNLVPTIGSQILEVSWQKDKPVSLLAAYKVQYANIERLEGGRGEYGAVNTQRDIINATFKEQAMRNLTIHVRE